MLFSRSRWKKIFKIQSGEHHTAEWWQQKADLKSIQTTVFRLRTLMDKDVVEKVGKEDEIVRFIPTASFSENDVVAMLQSK